MIVTGCGRREHYLLMVFILGMIDGGLERRSDGSENLR